MVIYFATDHAGLELKNYLFARLAEIGYEVSDFGAFEYNPDDDYPDFVNQVAQKVSQQKNALGIVLGGSGQGEAMVANRYKNVRAIVYYGGPTEILELGKEHNNANVISLGARFLTREQALQAVQIWLDTKFSEAERHKRRIKKIDASKSCFSLKKFFYG